MTDKYCYKEWKRKSYSYTVDRQNIKCNCVCKCKCMLTWIAKLVFMLWRVYDMHICSCKHIFFEFPLYNANRTFCYKLILIQ